MSFDAEGFAHRVKSARVWRGLAPKELAAALGRTDQSVYDLESGTRRTPPDKLLLQALAAELGQSIEWLLDGPAPPWRDGVATRAAGGEGAAAGPSGDPVVDRLAALEAAVDRQTAATIEGFEALRALLRRELDGREPQEQQGGSAA